VREIKRTIVIGSNITAKLRIMAIPQSKGVLAKLSILANKEMLARIKTILARITRKIRNGFISVSLHI